jgi:hypothetical protein
MPTSDDSRLTRRDDTPQTALALAEQVRTDILKHVPLRHHVHRAGKHANDRLVQEARHDFPTAAQ